MRPPVGPLAEEAARVFGLIAGGGEEGSEALHAHRRAVNVEGGDGNRRLVVIAREGLELKLNVDAVRAPVAAHLPGRDETQP